MFTFAHSTLTCPLHLCSESSASFKNLIIAFAFHHNQKFYVNIYLFRKIIKLNLKSRHFTIIIKLCFSQIISRYISIFKNNID